MVLRNRLGRIDRKEFRRAAVAHGGCDRVRRDLAVDRAGGEIGVRLLVTNGLGGLVGGKLDDLDLRRIDAVLPQDHLEQIDVGLGAADDADAMPGELADFRDGGRGFLPLGLGRSRHPQHHDVLAQRRHGLRILRHIEVAPDDGKVGLAFSEQIGAGHRAIGLHRAQPDHAVSLVVEGLRQVLNDFEVVAVGRADGDPQGHGPHGKVIAGHQRTDDGQHAGQRDEGQPSFR